MNSYPSAHDVLRLTFVAAAILVIGHWQPLSHWVPTIDSENSLQNLKDAVVPQGRFLSYLILLLIPPSGSIFNLDLLIAIGTFSVAIAVAVLTWRPGIGPEHYVSVLVAAAFPTTTHMFAFSTINMVVGIGSLMASLAVLAWTRGRFVAFALLTLGALSTYQGLISVLFVIFSFVFTLRIVENGPSRRVIVDAVAFVVAVMALLALYALATWGALALLKMRLLTVGGAIDVKSFTADPAGVAWRTLVFTRDILSGRSSLFLDLGIRVGALQIALLALAIGACLLHRAPVVHRLIAAGVLILAAISPYVWALVGNGGIRNRSNLGAPFGIAGLVIIAGYLPHVYLRRAAYGAAGLLAVLYVQVTMQMHLAAARAWDADKSLAAGIIERLHQSGKMPAAGEVPFEMIGTWQDGSKWLRPMPDTTLGWSFFNYGHSPQRAVGGMRLMGYRNFKVANPSQRFAILEKVKTMPVWPAPGSVDVIDGIAVVKFERTYSRHQKYALCYFLKDIKGCQENLAILD